MLFMQKIDFFNIGHCTTILSMCLPVTNIELNNAYNYLLNNNISHTNTFNHDTFNYNHLYKYVEDGHTWITQIKHPSPIIIQVYHLACIDDNNLKYITEKSSLIYTVERFTSMILVGDITLTYLDKNFTTNPITSAALVIDDTNEIIYNTQSYAEDIQCSICMTNKKQICLDCGHLFCKACSEKLVGKCFICKKSYTKLLRIYL